MNTTTRSSPACAIAQAILILGPGEAKGEFRKRMAARNSEATSPR